MPLCSWFMLELPQTDPAPMERRRQLFWSSTWAHIKKNKLNTPQAQTNTKIPYLQTQKFLAQHIKLPKEAKMRKGQSLLSEIAASALKTMRQNELCCAALSPSTTCLLKSALE